MAQYIGKKAICDAIGLSKLCCYQIHHLGNTYPAVPIYQYDGKSTEGASADFSKWFDLITQNNSAAQFSEWDMYLYEDAEGKKRRVRFTFAFFPAQQQMNGNNYYGHQQQHHQIPAQPQYQPPADYISKADVANIVTAAVDKAMADRENSELLTTIEELQDEIEEMKNGGMNGQTYNHPFFNPLLLQGVSMVTGKPIPAFPNLPANQQPNAAAAMNGNPAAAAPPAPTIEAANFPERTTKEKFDNINAATARLSKCNADIDMDLLHLADIAEKQPMMFAAAIQQLRSIKL